ncbi:MAG: restriction endonuclease subunit S [Verrucomicrobiota bacterium]
MGDAEKLITENLEVWASAVKAKSSAGRGSNNKRELYGMDRLRELILELAIRGLLTPQDPNDESAVKIREEIEVERARLVEDGTIKKKKALPPISDEEKPFELPSSWEWLRLSEVGHDWGQKKPESDFTYIDVSSINKERGIVFDPKVLTEDEAPSRARKLVKEGTVIYSTVRPYLLNIAVVAKSFDPLPIASTAFAIVHPFQGILASYIYRYLRSPTFISYVGSCQTGIAYPAINDKQFFSGVLPVPPLAEQHRIVAKVDELMALCDQLEQEQTRSLDTHDTLVATLLGALTTATADAGQFAEAWQHIQANFDILFTTESSIDQLKQTILQLAVMGKLVGQNPEDESADEALEILKTKQTIMFAEEGLRKRKPVVAPTRDEWPHELPRGWAFPCFESVSVIVSGVTKGRKLAGRKTIHLPYLRVANVQRHHLDLDIIKEIEVLEDDLERYRLESGDVLMTEGGDWDKVGRAAVWQNELQNCIHQNHVYRVRVADQEILAPGWVVLFANSPSGRRYFEGASKQTTNLASINMTQLRGCPLPLPPAAEQHRIVAKVDELMTLCDQLKASLATAQATQLNLADSLVEQAIG